MLSKINCSRFRDSKPALIRVAIYLMCFLGARAIAEEFFMDVRAAENTMMIITVFAIESLLSFRYTPCRQSRSFAFFASVAAMVFFAVYLMHDGMIVQADTARTAVLGKRTTEMLDNAPGAIFATDDSGIIEACSDDAMKLTGYSRAELLGQPLSMVITQSSECKELSRDCISRGCQGSEAGWSIKYNESVLKKKDGKTTTVGVHVFAVQLSVYRRHPHDVKFVSICK